MKKIIGYLVVVFILFLAVNVSANTINSIKMDIYIDSNGNAHVTEVWDAYLDEGTEGYRTYIELEGASIRDFKVSDNGVQYKTISYWDTGASFSEKAYKSGINRISDGLELCFGISEYGSHEYTLTYTINGFVFSAVDADVIYWHFINEDLASITTKYEIDIYTDTVLSNKLDVWGYGNSGGLAYVDSDDGHIKFSKDDLKNDEYVVGLIKFSKGTFNTSNTKNNDFNYYYEKAEKDSKKYIDFGAIISFLSSILVFVVTFVIVIFASKNSNKQNGSYNLDFGQEGNKLPKEVNMFRDIPCNKDIFRAYWVAHNYGLMKKQTDFLGTVLLKWVKQKHIEIKNSTTGIIFKKEETNIFFPTSTPALDTELEKTLYNYMYTASNDGVLESKEFENWCKSNYQTILDWFGKVLDYESEQLINEGMLIKGTKKVLFFNITIYTVNPKMKEEAVKMKGLKEFFNYFKNMDDKEVIEVMLWEEYLMYAQIFGVAKEVAEQFKKLYPDVITDYDYESVVFIRTISYSSMNSAKSALEKARAYNSGGGGFSRGGGGGGSFGGGGGGFR